MNTNPIRTLATRARRAVADWQGRRRAHAAFAALDALDARTLRDLGLRREEIGSIVAEIAGDVEATRCRALLYRHAHAF